MAGRVLIGQVNKSIRLLNPIVYRQPNSLNVINSRTFSDDAPIQMDNPFEREKRVCILCKLGIEPDYKNVKLLSQFQSPYTGKVYSRNITGLCKNKQARVVNEVLRAQNAGLMAYYLKDLSFVDDPKLFDPEKPHRPHPY